MNVSSGTLHVSDAGRQMQSKVLAEHLAHWAAVTPDEPAITYLDYLRDPDGAPETVTFLELERRVEVATADLLAHVEPGERAALMAPQSLAYIVYFVACLRAGVIAVPLFSPDLPGHGDRLAATFADCDPALVLATQGNEELVHEFLRGQPGGASANVLVIDRDDAEVDLDVVQQLPTPAADDLAYIQYTSGSTRLPAGVLISQGNIVANASQAILALTRPEDDATVVSWLPLFHDMGLVFVVGGSVVGGMHTVVMDPISFLIDPSRWIRALADHPSTVSLAPNFAYAYAASKVSEEDKATMDLSRVLSLGNGAEPVRPDTLDAFQQAFGPRGLPPHTVRPVYGLAEATVYVSGSTEKRPDESNDPVLDVELDVVQLSHGVATEEIGSESIRMVSVGLPNDQLVAIVDPDTGVRRQDGQVGEIWVHGPNVASGYWEKPELTGEVFGNELVDGGELPVGPWMRTGDLGVMLHDSLFITGRIKDLIIVGGRNHYPQDLEATVEGAHRVIGRHRTAAFSVDTDEGEAVVVVAEVSRHAEPGSWDDDEVGRAVSMAVSQRHSVALHDVVLVEPNRVPRTSSGKIARSATRDLYLEGSYERTGSNA